MSDQKKIDSIIDQGGGCILRFEDGKLATLVELAAYTDDEIEQGVPDDPEAPFEVSVKTAHKNVRESFATIEDAIADIVNTEGGTVEELSDEFSFEVTEEHLGMTMDEIKSALGR